MIKEIAKWILKKELEETENIIFDLETELEMLKKKLPEPKKLGKITLQEIKSLLYKNGLSAKHLDNWYYISTKEEILKFAKETFVHKKTYVSEENDCEDFSLSLIGYFKQELMHFPFGFAGGGGSGWAHAFNIFVALDENNIVELYIYEPQTTQCWKYSELNNLMYTPIGLIMI